jgi:DNA-directed RNA polymerase I, II, and III subunit RPABC2
MDEKYGEDDYVYNQDDESEVDEEEEINTQPKIPKKIASIAKTINKDGDDDDLDDDDEGDEEYENNEDEEDENEEEIFEDDAEAVKQNIPHFDDLDNEDEDEDEEDDNYLQKFDENLQKNIIADFHPESLSHNYNEIEIMSRVVRNEGGTIIDPLHRTLPFVTRYERARILGERAKQLNSGARAFVEVDANVIDGYLIALKEFEEKKIPFIVKRPLPNGGCEYWKFKDLEILA